MMGTRNVALAALIALAAAPNAIAHDVPRIDGSSAAAAQKSFERMNMQLSQKRRQDLAIAVLKINLIGVNSAKETIDNPELLNVGIGRIKERVSGMTADEIIKYADANATVKVEVSKP